MGRIASEFADIPILTSDNPRSENPEAILADIEKGMTTTNYIKIADRKAAINKAIEIANPEDIIIIAGKGHEDYQIIGREKIHFSDQEVLKELMQGRQSKCSN
jgi:UDP-N-acetylmuramoyl-L-alanyl-D-glutamate--2,6-diaminopimelate ligase